QWRTCSPTLPDTPLSTRAVYTSDGTIVSSAPISSSRRHSAHHGGVDERAGSGGAAIVPNPCGMVAPARASIDTIVRCAAIVSLTTNASSVASVDQATSDSSGDAPPWTMRTTDDSGEPGHVTIVDRSARTFLRAATGSAAGEGAGAGYAIACVRAPASSH